MLLQLRSESKVMNSFISKIDSVSGIVDDVYSECWLSSELSAVSVWSRACWRLAVWEEWVWCAGARGLARLARRGVRAHTRAHAHALPAPASALALLHPDQPEGQSTFYMW